MTGKVYVQLLSFTNCKISACFKGYLSESSVILSTNSVLKCTSVSVVDFRYANNFSQTVSTFEAFVMWQRRSNVCKEIIKRVKKCIKYTKCSQVIVINNVLDISLSDTRGFLSLLLFSSFRKTWINLGLWGNYPPTPPLRQHYH